MLHEATNKLKRAFTSTFLFRPITPRKAHLYCVGTAKSGTHSIAAILRDQLRSAHEPESRKVIDIILDFAAGRMDEAELRHYVLNRDRRLRLDVDSSQLNFFLLAQLVELFPEAKFLLTIRNPYAWLDSFINHQLAHRSPPEWIQLRELRFRPDLFTHSAEELALKEKGLYTLDGYLSYWARHNRTVIETVPAERLLIVRTDKISERAEEIAAFAGLSTIDLKREDLHAFPAKAKFDLLDELDQEYLEYKVKEHCADLMAQFFAEIQSKRDALPVGTS
jgi:hypothetical protein